jgi:hypothetical protein
MVKAIAACAFTACLAAAVALVPGGADAMSKPKAAKEASAETSAKAKPDKAFLWLRSISGWNSIDDEHIVLYGGVNQAALATTFGPCLGLSFAETIAVEAPLSYLDRSAFGTIHFVESGSRIRRRCQIDTLESVKDLKEAKALVESRKQQKAMEKSQGSTVTQ